MNNDKHKLSPIDYINIPGGDLDINTNNDNDDSFFIPDERRYQPLFIPESLNFLHIIDSSESIRLQKSLNTTKFDINAEENIYVASTYETEKHVELMQQENILDWLYKVEKEVNTYSNNSTFCTGIFSKRI
jgi:hypothetical protein